MYPMNNESPDLSSIPAMESLIEIFAAISIGVTTQIQDGVDSGDVEGAKQIIKGLLIMNKMIAQVGPLACALAAAHGMDDLAIEMIALELADEMG